MVYYGSFTVNRFNSIGITSISHSHRLSAPVNRISLLVRYLGYWLRYHSAGRNQYPRSRQQRIGYDYKTISLITALACYQITVSYPVTGSSGQVSG